MGHDPSASAAQDDASDDWFLRDALFDLLGEVYTDRAVKIVLDWLETYSVAGLRLGDAMAELEAHG
jgi:hypothetical protein